MSSENDSELIRQSALATRESLFSFFFDVSITPHETLGTEIPGHFLSARSFLKAPARSRSVCLETVRSLRLGTGLEDFTLPSKRRIRNVG